MRVNERGIKYLEDGEYKVFKLLEDPDGQEIYVGEIDGYWAWGRWFLGCVFSPRSDGKKYRTFEGCLLGAINSCLEEVKKTIKEDRGWQHCLRKI